MREIVLSLPAPISVNRTRRIDWRAHRTVSTWQSSADGWFLSQKRSLAPPIAGPYELTLTLAEGSRIDADNACKLVIDAVRRFRLVTDDDPKHMRRLVVEFGDVTGCRVTLRPWHPSTESLIDAGDPPLDEALAAVRKAAEDIR